MNEKMLKDPLHMSHETVRCASMGENIMALCNTWVARSHTMQAKRRKCRGGCQEWIEGCRTWRGDAGHGRVLPDMDAINACIHVMNTENVPGMDFLSVRSYTSVYGTVKTMYLLY